MDYHAAFTKINTTIDLLCNCMIVQDVQIKELKEAN